MRSLIVFRRPAHRSHACPAFALVLLQNAQPGLGPLEQKVAFWGLALGALLFLVLFVLDLMRNPPSVETHWGGFGGGMGGWRLSPSLLFLAAAIAFAALATTLLPRPSSPGPADGPRADSAGSATAA